MAKQRKKSNTSGTRSNSASKSGKKGSSSGSGKKVSRKKKSNRSSDTTWLIIWTTVISLAIGVVVREYFWFNDVDDETELIAYGLTKNRIHQVRLDYEQDWTEQVISPTKLKKQAKEYLYYTLTDSIFSPWYGTTWDFNGTTEKPKKGNIACGYFVTTTLEHCGFNLPRVKLAQQAASIIIKSLCAKESIKTYNQVDQLKTYMDGQENGIYILGLDTHVGYLWKSESGLFFVHASYSGNKQVSKEKWNESVVISKSKVFVVGDLLGNEAVLEAWIRGQRIEVGS